MSAIVSEISSATGISILSCEMIAKSAYRRYKVFNLAKKNGGVRVVAQPAREVKAVQRAICAILALRLPVHESATAYKSGSSILVNASAHMGRKYLTKLDFSDFFSCIDGSAISHLLRRNCPDFSVEELRFLIDVCTWRPEGRRVLCIGAPSSPLLSNAVLYEFDVNVSAELAAMNVRYTRYSDDIAISCDSPHLLRGAEDVVRKWVARNVFPALVINEAKRIAVGRGTSMTVTGLTLTNQGGVSVGRDRKRGIRAGISRFLKGGLSDLETERLRGEVAFVLSVEPEYRGVILRRYGLLAWKVLPGVSSQ